MPASLKLARLTRLIRVHGVDVYVHWSVFLIAALVLLGAIRKPLATLIGLAAYLGVLIIHEAGHLIIARLKGYDALSIELYPIHGLACFENPGSRFDRAAIAWGGVLAQAIVGVPLVVYVAVFGFTPWEALNAALAILGGFSLYCRSQSPPHPSARRLHRLGYPAGLHRAKANPPEQTHCSIPIEVTAAAWFLITQKGQGQPLWGAICCRHYLLRKPATISFLQRVSFVWRA